MSCAFENQTIIHDYSEQGVERAVAGIRRGLGNENCSNRLVILKHRLSFCECFLCGPFCLAFYTTAHRWNTLLLFLIYFGSVRFQVKESFDWLKLRLAGGKTYATIRCRTAQFMRESFKHFGKPMSVYRFTVKFSTVNFLTAEKFIIYKYINMQFLYKYAIFT